MFKKDIANRFFKSWRKKYDFMPVFIIGCGRSGTTILGKTLSRHPKIKYLNERRDLWHEAYPEFNIWDGNNKESILYATEKNIIEKNNEKIRDLFEEQQHLGQSSILLEKLPINNFRLKFLQASFPEAKYIYLTRNGLEVSLSIEKKIEKRNWFAGKKLPLLIKFGEQNKYPIKENISTNIEKAMWEWRISIDQSDLFFKNLASENFIHLSYEDFVDKSEECVTKILEFLNLDFSEKFLCEICSSIQRKNESIKNIDDNSLLKIGGSILSQTVNNTYSPI